MKALYIVLIIIGSVMLIAKVWEMTSGRRIGEGDI